MQSDQRQTDQPRTNRKYILAVGTAHPVLAGIGALVLYEMAYFSISMLLWLLLPFSFNTISGVVGSIGFIGVVIVGFRLIRSAAKRYERALSERARADLDDD